MKIEGKHLPKNSNKPGVLGCYVTKRVQNRYIRLMMYVIVGPVDVLLCCISMLFSILIVPLLKYLKQFFSIINSFLVGGAKRLNELSRNATISVVVRLSLIGSVLLIVVYNRYCGLFRMNAESTAVAHNSDFITFVYYIAFIVLTFLIVKYSKKTFKNQEKKPAHIQVRVNFGFHWKHDGATPVMLDIFNDGDETCNNLEIDMYIKNVKYYEDTIQFIAPHELFS